MDPSGAVTLTEVAVTGLITGVVSSLLSGTITYIMTGGDANSALVSAAKSFFKGLLFGAFIALAGVAMIWNRAAMTVIIGLIHFIVEFFAALITGEITDNPAAALSKLAASTVLVMAFSWAFATITLQLMPLARAAAVVEAGGVSQSFVAQLASNLPQKLSMISVISWSNALITLVEKVYVSLESSTESTRQAMKDANDNM